MPEGGPAPRLGDIHIAPEQAREWHRFMLSQVVLMLCAGTIHGDLSEFNVLVDAHRAGDHRPAARPSTPQATTTHSRCSSAM